MTAAKVQDDKSLVVTFVTADSATRFDRIIKTDRAALYRAYQAHKDRRIMFVGSADYIDEIALSFNAMDSVCSVHVDWYLG